MPRVYTVEFENVSVSAAQDFFEVSAVTDRPVCIHACYLAQTGVADVGDANEEMLRVQIIRGHATSGSGGTSPTPAPLGPNDGAAGFGADINNTTIASAGTAVVLHSETFNVRVGWQYIPTPEMRPITTATTGGLLVVRLMAAPADPITLSGTLYLAEL